MSEKQENIEEATLPHTDESFYKFEIKSEAMEACKKMAPEIIKANNLDADAKIEGFDQPFTCGLAYGYGARNKEFIKVLTQMVEMYHQDFVETGCEESKGKVSLAKYLLSRIE